MAGETREKVSGWTVDTYAAHNEALRIADGVLRAADDKYYQERDRRYSEVATEREKALKIKETADLAALGLAREIQTYKDEKANQLREQINSERGLYSSKADLVAAVEKIEAQMQPILSYVTMVQGKGVGLNAFWGYLVAAIIITGVIAGLVMRAMGH